MSAVATHRHSLAKAPLRQPLQTTTTTFHKRALTLRKRVALHYALRAQNQQAGFGRGTAKIKEKEGEVGTESEPPSGTKKLFNAPDTTKLPGTVKLQGKGKSQAKSNKVVFVAGATGKVGSRTVRELLKLGFSVRAGTRNVEKAQAQFEDVVQGSPRKSEPDNASSFGFFSPAKLFGFLKPKTGRALEIVECDLEDAESIEAAIGNAGVVVCCIGASEKEVLDVSGPYRIDFKATANLIDAASFAQVDHFVLLTSLGTQKFGFPAAVLNLFWGVLVWKAKAEKALLQSGIPFTIVRPGGMERPTDAYKETHNLILGEADKLFGGQVSNLQVAELIASIVENPDVSVNKIVETVAETTAPLRPIREMLEEIPAMGDTAPRAEPQSARKPKPAKADASPQKPSKNQEEEKRDLALKEKEEKRMQAEKLADEKRAKAQKEEEEKRIRDENEQKEKLKLQALRKKYEEEIEAAKEEEQKAKSAAAAALAEKAELEKKVAEIRAQAEAAALAASQAKAVQAAVVAAARKGNVLSDAEKEKIMESVRLASLPKADRPKESGPRPKKKPAFSFFGIAAPTTETEVEPSKGTKEEEAKVDVEPEVKAKADKRAATKVPEKKKQEDKGEKDEEAKKLAEQEAAKKLEAKQKGEQEAKQREEQQKLEREAKEQAEQKAAEAKRKEAEAQRKEEEEEAERKLEAKQKEEQEAKQREEQQKLEREAKEQAEQKAAEAKRKEEEAEAKRKEEEAEFKRKEQEAEARRKEEEAEVKRKEQEAEAKRKEEAEAKDKELAEAKRKKEEEQAERLRLETEAKAKEVEEQEAPAAAAAASAEAEQAPAPARPKGFRWFWQPLEPDTSEAEQTTDGDVAEVPAQAKVTDEKLPYCSRPLSPYARYPGLKPPSPPTVSPIPSTAKAEVVETPMLKPLEINRVEQMTEDVGILNNKEGEGVKEEQSPESQESIEARARLVQETTAREKEALERAQAAVTFKWPWQKSDSDEEVSASSSKVEESITSFVPKLEEKLASKSDTLPRSSRPLSPYAQFPGLKPPTPPRPSPTESNSTAKDDKGVETLPNSSTLSPYPGFPDLKPPTAPGPLQGDATNGAVPEKVAETAETIAETVSSSKFKWPWQQ